FYLVDRLVDIDNSNKALVVRCGFVGCVLIFFCMPKSMLLTHLQAIASLFVILAALGMTTLSLLLTNVSSLSGASLIIPAFILIMMFNFGFLNLLFVPSLISGLSVMLAFNMIGVRSGIDTNFLVSGDIYVAVALVVGGWVAYMLEALRRSQFLAEKQVNDLIGTIFPGNVLERVKAGESFIADQNEATVVFADIVGFTSIAKILP